MMDTCARHTMKFIWCVQLCFKSSVGHLYGVVAQLIGKAAERIEKEYAPDLFVAIGKCALALAICFMLMCLQVAGE